MTTELMKIDYTSAEVVKTLQQTVAVGATPAEFAMFTEFCKSTGLNPFKKEIWFIKAAGRVQLMTGINGFHAIANANDQYDGLEAGLIDPSGAYVSQAYPKNDFIGAWCKVYRKDRRIPLEAVAMLSEYDKGQGNWQKMKRVMIMKCAESVGLRKAFPQQLNGLYTAEEMPTDYGQEAPSNSMIVVGESTAEKALYKYEIWQLEDGKKERAQRYLEENGATFDEDSGHWVCPVSLPRLEQYEVRS